MRRLTLQFDLDALQPGDLREAFRGLARRCQQGELDLSQSMEEKISTTHIQNPREIGRLAVQEKPSLSMDPPSGEVWVRLEDIKEHIAFRRRINLASLGQLRVTLGGVVIPLDPEVVAEWEFTGLNNTDFLHMRLLDDC